MEETETELEEDGQQVAVEPEELAQRLASEDEQVVADALTEVCALGDSDEHNSVRACLVRLGSHQHILDHLFQGTWSYPCAICL